jgi:putative transposase
MASQPVAFLLARLGITQTPSRPHGSNDHPFSESQFKTLKYCPEFPERFGSLEDATTFCRSFFSWYNHDHRHSGIGLRTPAMVHGGEVEAVTQVRKVTLSAAFEAHPERFVGGAPRPPVVPEAAWINKPKGNSSISEACALAESTLIPRVQEDGSMRARRSCGIREADFLDPAPRSPGNDTNFVWEVSQNH